MRVVTIDHKVYSFDELSQEAKDRVIADEIDFMVQVECSDVYDSNGKIKPVYRNSGIVKAIKKSAAMQTPWFLGSYIWDFCEKLIMDGVRNNEYTEQGEIFREDKCSE